MVPRQYFSSYICFYFVWQVIADLQPQGVASLPSELTMQGIGARLDETGRVKLAKTRPPGRAENCAGGAAGDGDVLHSVGEEEEAEDATAPAAAEPGERSRCASRAPAAASPAECEGPEPAVAPRPQSTAVAREDEGMLAELRDMGLHVHLDPETGLVDICHPQAGPSKFTYG